MSCFVRVSMKCNALRHGNVDEKNVPKQGRRGELEPEVFLNVSEHCVDTAVVQRLEEDVICLLSPLMEILASLKGITPKRCWMFQQRRTATPVPPLRLLDGTPPHKSLSPDKNVSRGVREGSQIVQEMHSAGKSCGSLQSSD